jgi:hypothetical protein
MQALVPLENKLGLVLTLFKVAQGHVIQLIRGADAFFICQASVWAAYVARDPRQQQEYYDEP